MIKKLLYIFCLSLLILPATQSQNLIPNPGFEDVNICYKYNEPCSPKAWRSTVLKNISYKEFLGNKNKKAGGVKPAEGKRHIALRMYNFGRPNDRSFIQVPLACPLVEGALYELSFQLYTSFYMIKDLGVTFVDTMYFYKNNNEVLAMEPQVNIRFDEKIKSRKWTRVSINYQATGQEQGLIIGNFATDEQTVVTPLMKKKKIHTKRVYYAFDDFALSPLDSVGHSPNCDLVSNTRFLYQDTTRHVRLQKMETIIDIPNKPAKIASPPVSITPPEQPSLQIGNQSISVKEDFVLDAITFESNKAVLRTSAYAPLEAIADMLQAHPQYRLQITGHTDNVGSSDFNKTLSLQRAQAVASFLLSKGVAENRLFFYGKGELEPVNSNNTEAGRAENRRVAFKLLEDL